MRCRFGFSKPGFSHYFLILFGNLFGGLCLLNERKVLATDGLLSLLRIREQLVPAVRKHLLQWWTVQQLREVA